MSELAKELLPLSWLVGHWRGEGFGEDPDLGTFKFMQEVSLIPEPGPVLSYHSQTRLVEETGEHTLVIGSEQGYWRPLPDNGVEVMLALPGGQIELWVGSITVSSIENARITGARAELEADVLAHSKTAQPNVGGTRLYGLVHDQLMWAHDVPATPERPLLQFSAQLSPIVAVAEPEEEIISTEE